MKVLFLYLYFNVTSHASYFANIMVMYHYYNHGTWTFVSSCCF